MEEAQTEQLKHAWFVSYVFTDSRGTFMFGNTLIWLPFEDIEGIAEVREMEKVVCASGTFPSSLALLSYKREEKADKLFPVDVKPRLTRAK